MNWDAIGAIGEIVGAIAVVVSIVYLAIQISSNTRTMRANAGFEATHSWASTNEALAHSPDETMGLVARAFEKSWEDFSTIERARIGLLIRALFQKLEGQYYLFRYDTLDEGIWHSRSRWASGLLQTPFFRTWWEIEKQQLVYSRDFVRALEATEPLEVSVEAMGGELGGT